MPVDAPPVAAGPTSDKPEGENPYFPVKTTRRYGFTLGIVGGAQITNASGSSIKFTQRDTPTSTGTAIGIGESVWIGGAFTDWFAFHVGATFGSASTSEHTISGSGAIFGIETWPLFSQGGVFRDLGVGLDLGTGTAEVRNKATDKVVANGGAASNIRASLFWDALSLWKINAGPYVAYERRDAEVFSQSIVWVGLRTSLYGVNLK